MKSIKQIYEYWLENIEILETDLNFDWDEGATHCWNCGDNRQSKSQKSKVTLERCHIIPKSKGGSDLEDNLVLLCTHCHKEAPDTMCKEDMWDWFKSNEMKKIKLPGAYRIDKALQMFEERTGKCLLTFIKSEEIKHQLISFVSQNTSFHGNRISVSSYFYAMLNFAKEKKLF